MNVRPSTLDAKAVAVYAEQAKDQGVVAFLLDVIPGSVIGAFASGNILQVLLFAVMFGFALHRLGSKGQLIFNVIESFSQVIFGIINMIMRLAPIGAFGAMAFTIGKYGVGTLVQLGQRLSASISPVSFSWSWCWAPSPARRVSTSSNLSVTSAKSC